MSTSRVRRRAFHIYLLWIPALLLLLVSRQVGALAEAAIMFGAVLSPLSFIGRWHPRKQMRWCHRAYRDGFMPPNTTTEAQGLAFAKAWAQAGGPPPPLASPFDASGPYKFATDPSSDRG